MRDRDSANFPSLDEARRARRTPLLYCLKRHGRFVEIVVDGLFLPDEISTRLAALYSDYLTWWRREKPDFPRVAMSLPDFKDYVRLVIRHEDAEGWVRLIDAAGPLTFNRWRLPWPA